MAKLRQVSQDRVLVEVGDLRVLVEATCPHRKGLLRCAHVNQRTGRITCPLHHSTFDLATGARISGPADRSLVVEIPDD